MKVAIILFVYNRPDHTAKVLEGIKKCDGYMPDFFIFQDGKREDDTSEAWEQVNCIIKEINWCNAKIHVSEKNNGLANSIIGGLNLVFSQYDGAIVFEDDCVPHPLFLKYAISALEKYKNNKMVYNINGFAPPVKVEQNGYDAYFSGRIGSWGWATWKDRWEEYERDYNVIVRIKNNKKLCEQLKIWGDDLEDMVIGNIEGRCNSWAVFWALHVIEKSGFCLTPYKSLIDNIGFDGTGVHCGSEKPSTDKRLESDMGLMKLPEEIRFPSNYAKTHEVFYHKTPARVRDQFYSRIYKYMVSIKHSGYGFGRYFDDNNIESIAIWGKGIITDGMIDCCGEKIKCIIQSQIKDEKEYKGYPVTTSNDIDSNIQKIVIVPGYDFDFIQNQLDEENKKKMINIEEILEAIIRKSE